LIVSYVHPLFFKASASKADNSSWHEATRRQFADDYWEAMKLEVATLENIDAWSWSTGMTPMENRIMLYLALGYSSANNIQMDAL
jgi:hypothetical protein